MQLNGRAELLDRQSQRRIMLRDVGIVLVTDFIIMLILIGFVYPKSTAVYKCSPSLFWVGIGFLVYQVFFVLRNAILILFCYWNVNPNRKALLGRIGWACVDLICLTSFLIWATTVNFNAEAKTCRSKNDFISSWWLFCTVAISFGWIYSIVLCCLWAVICPLVSIFICWLVFYG
jgi:hypothetical protein